MRPLRTFLALSLAAGCAAQVSGEKDGLADPSFDDPSADEYSRGLDYRGSIAFGETLDGEYSATGYAGYSFEARAGAHASLALDGAGNDPVLYVYGPKPGDTWAYVQRVDMNDDYYGLDSFLDLTLPADGTYLVIAREYWRGGGQFALTLTCGDAECGISPSPPPPPPPPSDCRATGCGFGRSCDYCAAHWQCVPAGSQC